MINRGTNLILDNLHKETIALKSKELILRNQR
jgi:hypothetical protein